jgi:hypothetical protein
MQDAEKTQNTCKDLVWNPVERKPLKNLDVDGRIILRWIFKEKVCEDVDWIHLSEDTISVVRSCQRGIELSDGNSFTR